MRTIEQYRPARLQVRRIETPQGHQGFSLPAVRTVKEVYRRGWLTISTEKDTILPVNRTTLYTYNDRFRVSLEIKPNGGYRVMNTTTRAG